MRVTADGRTALRPVSSSVAPLPLAACVVPFPDRTASAASLVGLRPALALQRLAQLPRLVGWQEPSGLRSTFEGLADLVTVVPVLQARLPWGPPFPPSLVQQLLDGVADVARSGVDGTS